MFNRFKVFGLEMNEIIKTEEIQSQIFTIRGLQVMIDRDLAEMYKVETKVLNQAVKRNIERFPQKFRFQLNDTEKFELVTNCDRFEKLKHSSINPYVLQNKVYLCSRLYCAVKQP